MSGTLDGQVQLALRKSRESLHREFTGLQAAEAIDAMLDDSVRRIRSVGGIDAYVPALAERLARERLQALSQSAGTLPKDVPDVLFVGLHDTGRGQIGAAFMRALGGDRVSVHSAGTGGDRAPVDPGVAAIMQEVGIDLDGQYSKPLTPEVVDAADIVVTMGRSAGIVEIPPHVRHVDWRIGDPGGAPAEEIRHIRDDIRGRVQRLLDEIAPDEP